MRCVALLPGAELHPLTAWPSTPSGADSTAAAGLVAASPFVNGSVLAVRTACAAAVVDGTDVTWLGFDLFQ